MGTKLMLEENWEQEGKVNEGSHLIVQKMKEKKERQEIFYSFEFFPPRTEEGTMNLIYRMYRMCLFEPLFYDITWGAGGGDPSSDRQSSSMTIAGTVQKELDTDTMLHLTCAGSTITEITNILKKAKSKGIRNILALRGDPVEVDTGWKPTKGGFQYAVDLVRHIRKEFGAFFCIGVAGYPNGHPECESYEKDLQYTKEKLSAGADFIITQLFFRAETFIKYYHDCRAVGIVCPIIPGILPIQGYSSLRHLCKLSALEIPNEIITAIEPIKDNDKAIRDVGVDIAVDMCKKLINANVVDGFHFYTLNREVAVVEIINRLELVVDDEPYDAICYSATNTTTTTTTTATTTASSDYNNNGDSCELSRTSILEGRKSKPWVIGKRSSSSVRCKDEEVIRPIFWARRYKSYLSRTLTWDEFPNGRWGNTASPAYGELKQYYLFYHTKGKKTDRKQYWGVSLQDPSDVSDVFCNFLNRGIPSIPWCDSDALTHESDKIMEQLLKLNSHGIYTINSQPAVNGCRSDDPVHGWGYNDGYVYQKAYLEFFIDKKQYQLLRKNMNSMKQITYHALDYKTEFEDKTNSEYPNAVTWGIFPNMEVLQPTIVDSKGFRAWKDEAFGLWSIWADLYEDDSLSKSIIENIQNSYLLVNVVDNDFIHGDIFRIFNGMVPSSSYTRV